MNFFLILACACLVFLNTDPNALGDDDRSPSYSESMRKETMSFKPERIDFKKNRDNLQGWRGNTLQGKTSEARHSSSLNAEDSGVHFQPPPGQEILLKTSHGSANRPIVPSNSDSRFLSTLPPPWEKLDLD